MTTLNTSDLRAKAEAATAGPWSLCQHLKSVEDDIACRCGYRGVIWGPDHDRAMAICQPGHDAEDPEQAGLAPERYPRPQEIANAAFIAAANPATMLALLDLLEEAEGALEWCVHTIEAMRPTFVQAKDEGHAYHDQIADQARTTLAKIRSAR